MLQRIKELEERIETQKRQIKELEEKVKKKNEWGRAELEGGGWACLTSIDQKKKNASSGLTAETWPARQPMQSRVEVNRKQPMGQELWVHWARARIPSHSLVL